MLVSRIGEQIDSSIAIPDRQMRVATAPRQLLKRFRHEGGPQAPPFRQRLDHIFEKRLSVGRLQGFGVLPIDFELTIGVLVIILIRPPPQEFERVANLSNQVELSH